MKNRLNFRLLAWAVMLATVPLALGQSPAALKPVVRALAARNTTARKPAISAGATAQPGRPAPLQNAAQPLANHSTKPAAAQPAPAFHPASARVAVRHHSSNPSVIGGASSKSSAGSLNGSSMGRKR